MLFPIKSEATMLQEILNQVTEETEITNLSPGSIARTLVEIFNRRLSMCYDSIDMYSAQCFVSTASGVYLSMIGKMLGCERYDMSETDDNYRYRITKQVFTAAAANYTAIRLQCLSVPYVKDVIITPYTRGNGSFTVHVITDELSPSPTIIESVNTAVKNIKAEGVRAIVTSPNLSKINISFNIIPKTGIVPSNASLESQLLRSIQAYLDTIPMGGKVSLYVLLQIATTNSSVSQAYINSLYIDDEPVIIKSDYQLEWDTRIYVDKVEVVMEG
jgi:uncharacterized phage protein gp47/JayE